MMKLGVSLARHLASASERVERAGPLCARIDGFDLHGRVAFGAAGRERLEELVRYCARPPLANDRPSKCDDGHYLLRLKAPWRDEHVILQVHDAICAPVKRATAHVHAAVAAAVAEALGIDRHVPARTRHGRAIAALRSLLERGAKERALQDALVLAPAGPVDPLTTHEESITIGGYA